MLTMIPVPASALSSFTGSRPECHLAELNQSDADLASRVAAGDRGALERLFHQHGGAVKSVAFRVLRDQALAEDVVQDTFVGLWRAPHRYDPARGSLRTFLLTIAHRRAVDMVRSEEARSRRESRPLEPDRFDLEEEVMTRDLSAQVRDALSGLADGEREAIVMAYFGGLSYVEVAQRLGAPEGTVKSRIRSGMQKLASSLQEVSS